MKRLPLLIFSMLAACSGTSMVGDGGRDTPSDLALDAPQDAGAMDTPPADVATDTASDAGPPDLGVVDAGPSTCLSLPTSLACDGTTRTVMGRTYCIHVPPGYHSGTAVPVVLLLHGYSATGPIQAGYLGLARVSDARTFLLIEPDGMIDSVGQHYWNASPACCAMFATSPPDDVAFLTAVLDDVEAAYTVDRTREYVMGHSNGGFMTHRLACERGARFAAGASLAGGANMGCTPTVPVPILEVHGDTDTVISYRGGTNPGSSTAYPSVEQTLAYWAAADGCDPSRREIETRELACDLTDHETHVERYSGCAGGSTVELWRMVGAGHVPLFRAPEWPMGVIDFLFAHTR